MADPITTTATTLEGQFLELSTAMLLAESANIGADNTPITDNVQLTEDGDDSTVTVTATIPVSLSIIAGGLTSVANPFLP